MRDHLLALKALTEAWYPTFLFRAPQGQQGQYVVWGSPGTAGAGEWPVAVGSEDLDERVRLLCRGENGDSVAIMLDRIQKHLSPSRLPKPFAVTGRRATAQWLRSEFVDADLEVTLPNSNAHPFYGVDTYHLVSQPAGS